MKILVLNFEYPPLGGGASPAGRHISLELLKNGHEVTVVTMGFKDLPAEEMKEGIKMYRIPSGRKLPNMSYPREHLTFIINSRKFLKKHLARQSYDVVHCHFIIPTGFLADWVYRKYSIPYVLTSHGSDLPGYNPDRFKLLHLVTPLFIRRFLNNCSVITTGSQYLADLIIPHLKQKEKLQIIPNGISIPPHQELAKDNIILSTGRLLKRKGFHTLISAVREHELAYEVHICGDGPMRKELETLAVNSKTKIVFHGWLDNTSDEYLSLLKRAKIFCLTSIENASLSLLESMTYSCAVITSNISGCAETVGDAGLLIPPENPDELYGALRSLIDNPEKLEKLRHKARRRVETVFSWPRIGKVYEQHLVEAVKQNPKRHEKA